MGAGCETGRTFFRPSLSLSMCGTADPFPVSQETRKQRVASCMRFDAITCVFVRVRLGLVFSSRAYVSAFFALCYPHPTSNKASRANTSAPETQEAYIAILKARQDQHPTTWETDRTRQSLSNGCIPNELRHTLRCTYYMLFLFLGKKNVAYTIARVSVGLLSPRAFTRGGLLPYVPHTVPSRPMFCSGRCQLQEEQPKTRHPASDKGGYRTSHIPSRPVPCFVPAGTTLNKDRPQT